MRNRSKLGAILLVFLLGGCAGRRATQAELPLLPDPFFGKIWLFNHWTGKGADGLPKMHYAALVNQVAEGDGGGAGWVSTELNAETSHFAFETNQYPGVFWSASKRWPVYWRVEPEIGEPYIPFHWGREHIWLGKSGMDKIELDWKQKKPYEPEHWAKEGGGIYSITPILDEETGSFASVSVFPVDNSDLGGGNARYFMEIQYNNGEYHRHFGLVDAFGDATYTESMVLKEGNPPKMDQVGMKWEWPKSEGFDPISYPAFYLFTPDQGKRIIPRKQDQSLQFGAYTLWMGAIEVRSTTGNELLGFGNLCIMTRR